MSSVISTVFVLTGPLAGKTVNLGKSNVFPFVNGKLAITANMEEMALYARFLERNWQAYPEGHPNLEVKSGERNIQTDSQLNEQRSVQRGVQSSGEGTEASKQAALHGQGAAEPDGGTAGVLPGGDGHPAELNERLVRAVHKLDPEDDSHWTQDGKPAMSAVELFYGSAEVTRALVDEACPGFNRRIAKGAKNVVPEQETQEGTDGEAQEVASV